MNTDSVLRQKAAGRFTFALDLPGEGIFRVTSEQIRSAIFLYWIYPVNTDSVLRQNRTGRFAFVLDLPEEDIFCVTSEQTRQAGFLYWTYPVNTDSVLRQNTAGKLAFVLELCYVRTIRGWGCSSVGRASDRHAADGDSIPRCGKGVFFPSKLSLQTLWRCPHNAVCNRSLCTRSWSMTHVHVRVREITETLKHPAFTVGWATRLCRSGIP